MNTTLHLPIDKKTKQTASKLAKQKGYSSLQELLRVFLASFVAGQIQPTFVSEHPPEFLTEAQEQALLGKLAQAQVDMAKGNYQAADSVEELMKQLDTK